MRAKIVLMALTVLLFTAGVLIVFHNDVTKAHAADATPRPAYLGVNVKSDATVVNVLPNSPAYKVGVRPGDVITSLHGETVTNDIELHNIMLSRAPGEKTSISVLRNPTKDLVFNVTLAERTLEVYKHLPRHEILEWSGPKDPMFFQQQAGVVTVYYFTATWCAPCKELRPHIEKVYKQFKNNPLLGFVAVAISDDKNDREEYKALVKLQKKGHYPFTIMRAPAIWKDTGVETVPTVIIVNQDGYIVGEYHGKDLLPDKCATLAKELKLMLENPVPNILLYWF